MAKRKAKKPTLEQWFRACGSFEPPDLAVLRAGIATGFLNEQDEYGLTALHKAAVNGWVEGIEELLLAGADTETRYHRTGETPLLSAVMDLGTPAGEMRNCAAVMAVLLAGGANPDAANHYGLTPRGCDKELFKKVPKRPVRVPEARIQNAEHLADHYWPHFKIPELEERQTLKAGTAVNLHVYGPRRKNKQEAVKVRITARNGRGSKVRYKATVETPLKLTHLPHGTTEVEFGPENIATVYVPRRSKSKSANTSKSKDKKRKNA